MGALFACQQLADEVQFAEEVVLGLADAAAIHFSLQWKEACRTIVQDDADPKVSLYGLLVDEKNDRFKQRAMETVLILYRHLAWHQLVKRNNPEGLRKFRRDAANGVSFFLHAMAAGDNSAIASWIRAEVSETAFWDFTLETLRTMNEANLRIIGRRN